MTTMVMTTISSTKAKPRRRRREVEASGRGIQAGQPASLPLGKLSSIERPFVGFGIDVVQVLAAKAIGLGVVLIGPHSPIFLLGEWVARDAPQEAQLFAVGTIGQLDALDELVEGFGVAESALLHGT